MFQTSVPEHRSHQTDRDPIYVSLTYVYVNISRPVLAKSQVNLQRYQISPYLWL